MTHAAASSTPPSKHPYLPPKPGIRVRGLRDCTEQDWHGQTERVWVDVEQPTHEQIEALKGYFALNQLALEDALETEHWSRFERYPEHLFLIFRTLAEPEDLTERTEEIDLFWFPEQHALVTFRHEPVSYLEAVWQEVGTFQRRTPEEVLYDLLQRGTDTFFTFLDELEDRTEELEQRLFDSRSKPGPEGSDVRTQPLYQEIFGLRRTLTSTRRRVSSAREHVAQFSRHASELSPQAGIY